MVKVLRIACCFALAFVVGLLVEPLAYAESGDSIYHSFDQVPALRNDSRGRKVSSELQINSDSSLRLVVPNKCEEQGEIELQRLTGTSALEESYVFIPALCLWIETGYDETYKTVRVDTSFIDDILRDYPSIIIYHIHVGARSNIAEYFPAYSDMTGLILINAKFFMDSRVKIIHRAVTTVGTIDYTFILSKETERLINKLFQTGLGDFLAQNLAYEFDRESHKHRYYAAVQDCISLSGGRPENVVDCFPMRADDFVLRYRSISNDVVADVRE